jgi:hypothetical protein
MTRHALSRRLRFLLAASVMTHATIFGAQPASAEAAEEELVTMTFRLQNARAQDVQILLVSTVLATLPPSADKKPDAPAFRPARATILPDNTISVTDDSAHLCEAAALVQAIDVPPLGDGIHTTLDLYVHLANFYHAQKRKGQPPCVVSPVAFIPVASPPTEPGAKAKIHLEVMPNIRRSEEALSLALASAPPPFFLNSLTYVGSIRTTEDSILMFREGGVRFFYRNGRFTDQGGELIPGVSGQLNNGLLILRLGSETAEWQIN